MSDQHGFPPSGCCTAIKSMESNHTTEKEKRETDHTLQLWCFFIKLERKYKEASVAWGKGERLEEMVFALCEWFISVAGHLIITLYIHTHRSLLQYFCQVTAEEWKWYVIDTRKHRPGGTKCKVLLIKTSIREHGLWSHETPEVPHPHSQLTTRLALEGSGVPSLS